MADEDDFTFCSVGPPINGDKTQKDNGVPINDANGNAADKSTDVIWNINSSSAKTEKVGSLTEKVGSLSFNVINASSREAVGSSSKVSSEQKPKSRAKVPFEKGYSQMDWLKLTRTHPDLAGLKGKSNKRLILLSEVKEHRTEDSMWTVLKGRVYNITPYMKFHPGGVDILMKAVGKDCTSLFNKYHAWVNAEFLLEKCLVGVLDEGK